MTSQKSKSPESIAMGIMIKSRKETGKLDPFYIHDHKIIFKEIIEAIKAERENNRLVLPERRVMNFEWGYEHENSSVFGFNRCLDEVIKLNEGRVFNKIPIVVDKDMPENEIELRGQYNSIKITNIKLDEK